MGALVILPFLLLFAMFGIGGDGRADDTIR